MISPVSDTKPQKENQMFLNRLVEVGIIISVVLAMGYIFVFILLALFRMRYPFELEWIEGAFVDEARWILAGHIPYGSPSIHFLPTIYTPFFFYISAMLMKVVGVGFLAPRLLSVLSTVGCLVLIYRLVTVDTGQKSAGIIAAGIYAASFVFAGAWMDLAKTDSLFLFLLLLAFWIGRRFPDPRGFIISGFLFALAFLTKQLALPIILIFAPISLIVCRWRTWPQWLSVSIFGLASFILLQSFSQGWFAFYTYQNPLLHGRAPEFWLPWLSFLQQMWPVVILAAFYAVSTFRETRLLGWRRPEVPWLNLGFGSALVIAGLGIFIKSWTYDNAYMPACLGLAFLAGLGYAEIQKPTARKVNRSTSSLVFKAGGSVLVFGQLAMLFYNPLAQLPTRNNQEVTQQFVEYVSNLTGEAWVFNHGFFNHLAGKTTYFHSSMFGDIVGGAIASPDSDTYRRREQALQVFGSAVSGQQFDWIIVDKLEDFWFPYYVNVEDIPYDFYPITGAVTRPKLLLAKNPVSSGGELPLGDQKYNKLFIEGWSDPENGGRWAIANNARINIALEQDHTYLLSIHAQPNCANPDISRLAMTMGWNNHILGNENILSCETHDFKYYLPDSVINNGYNELWLNFSSELSLTKTNASQDAENPLVYLTSINFTQQ
jgi:4-amino-4-deoxy-L-arabinose transferase-like glycosyltransferase